VAREYEFNADFDLSLRARWRGPKNSTELRQIDEMALHVALVGDSDDSVRLPADLPEEFLVYLSDHGLRLPELTVRPRIRGHQSFQPFGWNLAAAELNRRYERPVEHPPLDVVRAVNARSFAARIEREMPGRPFQLGEFASVSRLADHLQDSGSWSSGWIAKSQHGNAGLGNRRLSSGELSDVDRRWLDTIFAEDDLVFLEPWVQRAADLCTIFEVDPHGTIVDLSVHEVVNTADGAFIGALFDTGSGPRARWLDELVLGAEAVAERLSAKGYSGPVCLDSFVWQDGDSHRLRRLADLNARLHMSRPARRLWKLWDSRPVVYWRFFARRKLRLPGSFDELRAALGSDAYDSDSGRGTLVTSPLWIVASGRRVVPRKLGVLMVDETRAEVMAQEQRFRERFEG
jgi:hypothetical protein